MYMYLMAFCQSKYIYIYMNCTANYGITTYRQCYGLRENCAHFFLFHWMGEGASFVEKREHIVRDLYIRAKLLCYAKCYNNKVMLVE